jgi:two-component system NtrC family sensor kinase
MNELLQITSNEIAVSLFSGVLVLALIFGFIMYFLFSYRHKQKDYKLLQSQKEEIDNQRVVLENTLEDLKAAQSQLIYQERMASLGELTAGIAHEIQNPLNFINNFSDVNVELMAEIQNELRSGNIKESLSISTDIIENEKKINQHGKRADSIVKGMLQHARTSAGQKELTDINKMADDYLRLSYLGFRAKDKIFNATLLTDYDESVGKINIIPQDIGRLLLNLYNNAFYAVIEKMKFKDATYEPTVSIITKKLKGKIQIRIKDNGMGVPKKVSDKIFQPFFTTKPSGQGTGLGLSLSYDIVKVHDGTINFITEEGVFTEFTVQLPL